MIGPNDEQSAPDDLTQLEDAHGALARTYLQVHRLADQQILLRATVDAHVRRGLCMLRKEYSRASVASDSSKRKAWLKGEARQLVEHRSVGLRNVRLSGASVCSPWRDLGDHALRFHRVDGKRELFVKEGVYDDEDAIYRALGVAKQREPSL